MSDLIGHAILETVCCATRIPLVLDLSVAFADCSEFNYDGPITYNPLFGEWSTGPLFRNCGGEPFILDFIMHCNEGTMTFEIRESMSVTVFGPTGLFCDPFEFSGSGTAASGLPHPCCATLAFSFAIVL